MIRILVSAGFDIIDVGATKYGDHRKIKFRYTIHDPVKLRFSITDQCNLNCFFCHHEGIDTAHRGKPSIPDVEHLLVQAKKRNVVELTITGGEPFTAYEIIEYIIGCCSTWSSPPQIKIITNAQLPTEEQIRALSLYRGKISMHISLHCLEPEIARGIYGASHDLKETINQGFISGLETVVMTNRLAKTNLK